LSKNAELRTAATTTASLHPPARRQPKVDKTPDGPIIDVVSIIRGDDITPRNNGRFSKFANSLLFSLFSGKMVF
jgi:hypothetical protein